MKLYTWVHNDEKLSLKEWEDHFSFLIKNGINGIFLAGNKDFLKKVSPEASKLGLEVHAWFWALNVNNDDEVQKLHPDWFSVSRTGKSSLSHPPYVDYYKWLCPSVPEVKDYLIVKIMEILNIGSVSGIHLDYIRYPDQYLPKGLLDKYGLEDEYYPEFDFCYCDTCKKLFKNESGKDISGKNTQNNPEWLDFRLKKIIDIVNALSVQAHSMSKQITAAVFPTPASASEAVKQDWSGFDLDGAFPMLYNSFYEKDTFWIGECVGESIRETEGIIPIYAGIYIPDIMLRELENSVKHAVESGAAGLSFFPSNELSESHFSIINKTLGQYGADRTIKKNS